MNQVHIRTYQRRDEQVIKRLFISFMHELVPDHEPKPYLDYIQHAVNTELSRISELFIENQGCHFWIAEMNRKIIGMIGVQKKSSHEAEIRRLIVDIDLRRRGLGRLLLKQAEEFCLSNHYDAVVLDTSEIQTAAIRFYKAANYKVVGIKSVEKMTERNLGTGLRSFYFRKELR